MRLKVPFLEIGCEEEEWEDQIIIAYEVRNESDVVTLFNQLKLIDKNFVELFPKELKSITLKLSRAALSNVEILIKHGTPLIYEIKI